jgi:hypothetical protein
MIIPSTRLFTAGEVETGAYLNATITSLGNFVLGKPVFAAWQSTAQSLANNVYVPLTFTSETIDRDNGHSNVTNPSRYTAQTAGYYLFNGQIQYAANVTGARRALWYVNGALPVNNGGGFFSTSSTLLAATATVIAPPLFVYLAVGDYVELNAFQNSGGALLTVAAGGVFSTMSGIWVSV